MAAVDTPRRPADRILAVAKDSPELALLAAVVRQGLDDAQAGDPEAVTWLASDDCIGMLAWLLPPEADPEAVHAALLARIRPWKSWQPRLALDAD